MKTQRYYIKYTGSSRDEIAQLQQLTGRRFIVKELTEAYEGLPPGTPLPDDVLAIEGKWLNVALTLEQADAVARTMTGANLIEKHDDAPGQLLAPVLPADFVPQDYWDGLAGGKRLSNEWANSDFTTDPAAGNVFVRFGMRHDSFHGGYLRWNDNAATANITPLPQIINPSLFETNIIALHAEGYRGEGMRIGVIDSGATANNGHPDVIVAKAYNAFAPGTVENTNENHAYGRISQLKGGPNLLGAAPMAEIFGYNFNNPDASIAQAIKDGCDIISCAFNGSSSSFKDDLVSAHTDRGNHFCVAAGNGGYGAAYSNINSLASTRDAIAVSSYEGGGAYRFVRNQVRHTSLLPVRGKGVDLHAPEACVSALYNLFNPGTQIRRYNPYDAGTSIAVSTVAGGFALMKQKYRRVSARVRVSMVKMNGTKIFGSNYTTRFK